MGTPVPAHEVPTAEVRPSPTRVPPRETNPRRPSLVCEHPTHPPLPSSSPQLPEESELTWDCGDAYPEPALDVVPPHIVKPAEAAAYLFGGLGVFYSIYSLAKVVDKPSTQPFADKQFPFDNLKTELGK